jgi:hypothetical protein
MYRPYRRDNPKLPGVLGEVVAFVTSLNTWFTCDDWDDKWVCFSTREHGDVGAERPGREDLLEGRRIHDAIDAHFGVRAKTVLDVVGEWVNVNVRI